MAKKKVTAKPATPKTKKVDEKAPEIIAAADTVQSADAQQSADIDASSESTGSETINNPTTTDEQSNTAHESPITNPQTPITLLIPYLKFEAAGEELKYALRTWDKNFEGNLKVVIVGDREDWFGDEVVHIPHEVHKVDEDCNCDAPKKIRNPQADVAHKLLTAITLGDVEGDFILSNDDIFLMGQTSLDQIRYLKVAGTLGATVGKDGGLYQENSLRTAKLLKEKGLPIYRFGTHTPMVLTAETLVTVIDVYNATEQGTLLTSLYFNHVFPDARGLVTVTGQKDCGILASVYRSNPDEKILKQAFNRRLFINCNSEGWKALKPIFENQYPEKSRFEI